MYKFFIVSMIFTFSCQNLKKNSSTSQEKVKQLIGANYEVEANEKYDLYIAKGDPNWKTIVVLDAATEEIVYGPEKINGDISWYDTHLLKVLETPEVIKDKNSSDLITYFIDVATGKKTNQPENKL